MTEIADYLNVPLNTATGNIGRLEKRGVIKRDVIDKRVVTIMERMLYNGDKTYESRGYGYSQGNL